MFDALRERLEAVFDKLKGRGRLSEADVESALREVRRCLLEADVDYKVVKSLVDSIRSRAVGKDVLESITPGQQVVAVVYEELAALMGQDPVPLAISSRPPTVYLMVGLQGGGKTTTTVKIARKLASGHKPLVVACDLRRPAAVDQLRVLAEQSKIGFYGPEPGEKDVMHVVSGAAEYASSRLYDVILLDTAGRLHADEELMEELASLKRILPPSEILLVVDAMTGQEAVKVASAFHEKLTLTGVVLSKLDGDARGGAALAIRQVTGVPIKLAGVGEGTDALEVFDSKRMAQRIMGMGDVMGLAEKIREMADTGGAEKIAESIKQKKFTLEELLLQFEQIEKMGPLDKVLEMIPGFNRMKGMGSDDLDSSRLKQSKAIIQSMTKAERRDPSVIKGSRRRRIAQGSGTSVQMVNQLLAQYEQMRKLWKQFGKQGKGLKLPKGLLGGGGFRFK
ncbi:signal recognition particle protein [Aminivibrio sp.]|jgi:signal recognition particle subunit SRP54|uniref:signal recognition particle protein n=1 Tax=Aminivibrio sp. TaxID=1872489 RepID=UPI002A201906|nr:signal recognition particle protein [Synergistaceae bacterium]MDD3391015.1 signal recognition particle protein [Synergistaceae bacterium]MDD4020262.1 signal recognition particle protein [Synergistaceae bacterium]MDD4611684.1 signal recognition particle protein [Synergistaceae bacterium]